MTDESASISLKTWTRAVVNINKVGYSDGVTKGQNSTFQSSFDMGYKQGLSFGIELGYITAKQKHGTEYSEMTLEEVQHINCQICSNGRSLTENVVNLYNTQKEKNDEQLDRLRS